MNLLSVRGLTTSYSNGDGRRVQVVRDVSFTLAKGEVLGIVGESGCGKSTLAKSILRLVDSDDGEVWFQAQNVLKLDKTALKVIRQDMQIVFQDPFGSLNPRHTVDEIIGEPLQVHRMGSTRERKARVSELLDLVGLPPDSSGRHPHEFSGGQRQRIAIARALALSPALLVADEAVSALDVSIQSQIINLIGDLRRQLELSLLFISHDLSVIRHVSDRIAVMYLGRIVEIGNTLDVMNRPQHPYTQALVSAMPTLSEQAPLRVVLHGELPDPADPPAGCAFHTRCPHVHERCRRERPELKSVSLARFSAPSTVDTSALTSAQLLACSTAQSSAQLSAQLSAQSSAVSPISVDSDDRLSACHL